MFIWTAGVTVGTAIPLVETRQTVEEKVAVLKAIRAARDEKLGDDPDAQTLDQLFLDLGLADNPMLKSNPSIRDRVYDLKREYKDIFVSPEQEIGETKLIKLSIKLEDNAKPVRQRVWPLNPKQEADLRQQIDLWEKEGVIEETESLWASALVPVLKKGGGIRWQWIIGP